ncbi:MAG: hypothetical protein HOC09_18265 [Deltaproteobacteria bacterium]|jgi:hypothetical protein|nr:hypothetical protein [Deltaproteobacteria bacterium]
MFEEKITYGKTSSLVKTFYAFGFRIQSCIDIPVAKTQVDAESPDVLVHYGYVPEELYNPQGCGICFQAKKGEFLLKVKNVARFLILNGKEIVIDRESSAKDEEIQLFLLGSAFGALVYQRGLLPISASAVKIGNNAVLFTGSSGNGKSTLIAALEKKNYPVLSDGLSVVKLNKKGIPIVYPSFPQLNLWADALEKLDKSISSLKKVRPKMEKYQLSIADNYHSFPLPLNHIYSLQTTNRQEFYMEPVEGFEKFDLLSSCTFRPRYLNGLGMKTPHFEFCTKLSQTMKMTRVIRPSYPFLLDELVEGLERVFKK